MKHDPEKPARSQERRAPGKQLAESNAATIAGIVVLVAVVAAVALLLLYGREQPPGIGVELQAGAPPDTGPRPPVPAAADAGSIPREEGLPRAAERRRVTPRLRDASETPAADAEAESVVEEVIENEPGQELGPEVDARDYIEALRKMGETEGIAAFPPPGTDPPKTGVIVPDDYELPEGYERYYQYTDDGKPLEPILVYSPDYEFFDEQGDPIAIPKDHTVPPEMAPADLPPKMLDPLDPIVSGDGLIDPNP